MNEELAFTAMQMYALITLNTLYCCIIFPLMTLIFKKIFNVIENKVEKHKKEKKKNDDNN